MAKPNEIDNCAGELEPEPKQLWMVAAGAEAKSFYMMKPEIWVPVTLHCPWRASELTYCGTSVDCRACILILDFMIVRRGCLGNWIGIPNFEVWNYFFLVWVCKRKIQQLFASLKNCFWPPPVKIHYCPPWKKSSYAQVRLCVDQGFSNFFVHVPLSIKCINLQHLSSMLVK